MRLTILAATAFVCTLGIAGCGFTVLERRTDTENPCRGIPNSSLPDLAITGIVYQPQPPYQPPPGDYRPTGVSPHELPAYDITFKNVGNAKFSGAVLFSVAVDPIDIQNKSSPKHDHVQKFDLQPGDSVQIRIFRGSAPYVSGATFRFILQTESKAQNWDYPNYFFGLEPVCEASYANNIADYYMP